MKRLFIICACALTAIGMVGALSACKQGMGERCQVDADCADGLVCNKAKNTCQSTTGGDLDASVVDAPIDAPPDAP